MVPAMKSIAPIIREASLEPVSWKTAVPARMPPIKAVIAGRSSRKRTTAIAAKRIPKTIAKGGDNPISRPVPRANPTIPIQRYGAKNPITPPIRNEPISIMISRIPELGKYEYIKPRAKNPPIRKLKISNNLFP